MSLCFYYVVNTPLHISDKFLSRQTKNRKNCSTLALKVYLLFLSYISNIINSLNKEFQSEKVRLPYVYEQFESNFKLILSNFVKSNYINNITSLEALNLSDLTNYLRIEDVFIGRKAELYLEKCNLCILKKN